MTSQKHRNKQTTKIREKYVPNEEMGTECAVWGTCLYLLQSLRKVQEKLEKYAKVDA